MKARAGEPANTISRGSSPTNSVRVTCGVSDKWTMLTLSKRWLTTHISLSFRAATATGSIPTETRACSTSPRGVILKTSSVPLGVFTANNLVRSGDMAKGRTCPLSNSMNEDAEDAARTVLLKGDLKSDMLSRTPKTVSPANASTPFFSLDTARYIRELLSFLIDIRDKDHSANSAS